MMFKKLAHWIVQKFEKWGWLPTHHTKDPRLKRRYRTRLGLPYMSERELSERRARILANLLKQDKDEED